MNLRFVSLAGLASVVAIACANGGTDNTFRNGTGGSSGSSGSFTSSGGSSGSIITGGSGTGTAGSITTIVDGVVQPECTSACPDFPATPIFDDGVGPGDIGGFGDPSSVNPASFCLMEPQLSDGTNPGAMFPSNWLRPRFRWDGAAPNSIFEVRLKADTEANELVAYTKQDHWILPFNIWQHVGKNVKHVDVTVRALSGGNVTGVKGGFEIAPVNAGGTMVYWGTISGNVTPDSSFLVGFRVGDEAVVKALTLPQLNGGPAAQPYWGPILNENGKDMRGQYSPPAPGFTMGQVQCIGCHIQTPDKGAVIFTDDWPWDKLVTSIDPNSAGIGTVPDYITNGARAILKQPGLGMTAASPAYWSDSTKRILITSYYQDAAGSVPQRIPFGPAIDNNKGMPPAERLIWIDVGTTAAIPPQYGTTNGGMDAALQAQRNAGIMASRGTAWDYIPVNGETFPANILPNWSKDGSVVVYTAAQQSENGGLSKHAPVEADLHYVNFPGGDAKEVAGAAVKGTMEYYPALAPDNKFIAYTRADMTCAGYYNSSGEIYIVDPNVGKPIRLAANDPVSCGGQRSPGVLNSWPKWAPNIKHDDTTGTDYYFVIFSSARKYQNPLVLPLNPNNPLACIPNIPSQLYVAAVVKKGDQITTYPAVYLWNQQYQQVGSGATATAQGFQSNNLTPAWDEFDSVQVEVPPGIVR